MMVHHDVPLKDLSYLLVTVSTTRTLENDETGKLMQRLFEEKGKKCSRSIVRDDMVEIIKVFADNFSEFDVFVYSGGTGLTRYDMTANVLRKLCDREIKGFGETFRRQSYDGSGPLTILSDASLFIIGGKLVYAVPGSPDAQSTANELILSISDHVYSEINRK
ncbi:MAG: MogA/MoaB family molybdenum cofactor biosynthesis protein [Candidatus Thermoplasmatota archaeon]|nr:MogA/MoaB family molybdenum cofactor biosynthesis protein [Candidatus Thermoplasmatota archaeon]